MAQNREERREQFKKAFGANKVEIIPADERFQIDIHDREERVGAYSRVSTTSPNEEKDSSGLSMIVWKGKFRWS